MVIVFGKGSVEFEFSLDSGALRALTQLATEALARMDAYAEEGLGQSTGELVTVGEPRA